ncbi:NUDIX hydrolase [Acidisphaera sp. L21]|uniref:NUDIX domain-containing protein n=1 Tax=Acidisphaera sp. L21 TaxID=1641851 RepID=UPI00131DB1B6|nr:NUDIX hydrolase [Acidisphaera sp. L21]
MLKSTPQTSPEITQLTTRVAYQNRWLRVREDTVRRADGSDGLYGVVERTDFAIVVPWQDGCVTMVEQYRYPIGQRLWELPMGTLETGNATPEQTATTELREETGLVAADMAFIASLFQGPGYCNQVGHLFLATGLTQGPLARETSEQGMACRAFPLAEIEEMVRTGGLQDGMTLAALGMLRIRGLL